MTKDDRLDLTPFSGHTPGEWHLENKGELHGKSARCEIWAEGRRVAINSGLAEVDYANARLLASAPTLLVALRTAYDECDRLKAVKASLGKRLLEADQSREKLRDELTEAALKICKQRDKAQADRDALAQALGEAARALDEATDRFYTMGNKLRCPRADNISAITCEKGAKEARVTLDRVKRPLDKGDKV